MSDFGAELRHTRKENGLTLKQLSAAIGISSSHLCNLEKSNRRGNARLAEKFDRHLNAGGKLVALIPDKDEKTSSELTPTSGLPSPPQFFVGRAGELAFLTAITAGRTNLAVVSGFAGTGKTALALKAADTILARFGDAWGLYVDLRGHAPGAVPVPPAEAAYRLLIQLGADPDRIPADPDDRINALRAILRDRRSVIVLDNTATAAQVRPLLIDSEACRVIVTSRNRLVALEGARHIPLETLAEVEAVNFFRAAAGVEADGDEQAVTDIVRRCGLLPLMISIAAARFRTGNWTIARFLERLRGATALTTLNDGERDVAAAFRMSFHELTSDARRTLALLALHPVAGISATAAGALTGWPVGRLEVALDHLHDAHLIVRDLNGELAMHDLVRECVAEYALPEVDESDQRTALRRLATHSLALASAAEGVIEPDRFCPAVELPGPEPLPFGDVPQAVAWFRANWEMLTGLICAIEGESLCWRLAHVLRGFFFREKLFEPWIATNLAALRTARADGDQFVEALILNNLGMAHIEQGDLTEAAEYHAAARAIFARIGDRRGEIDALSSYAWVRLYQGEPEDTRRDLITALDGYRSVGHTRNTVIALRGLAFAASDLGDHDAALGYAQEAVELSERSAEFALCLNCIAWVRFRMDDFAGATEAYRQAGREAEATDDVYQRSRALTGLGNAAAGRDDLREAIAQWDLADETGVDLNRVAVVESAARERMAAKLRS